MTKYGFGGGIDLPKSRKAAVPKPSRDASTIRQAVEAGAELGFVDREPNVRLKPGPKRTEPQDKVSIPGPKRVTDAFRAYCKANGLTLWQGLERLLSEDRQGS